jgi:lipooligosaccharide transport system permease protein
MPGWIQPIAYITPLWHGVALCRGLSLGTATWTGVLLHAGYLVLVLAAGIWAGNRTYGRRLYV